MTVLKNPNSCQEKNNTLVRGMRPNKPFPGIPFYYYCALDPFVFYAFFVMLLKPSSTGAFSMVLFDDKHDLLI